MQIREASEAAKMAGINTMTRVMYGTKIPTVELLGLINHLSYMSNCSKSINDIDEAAEVKKKIKHYI